MSWRFLGPARRHLKTYREENLNVIILLEQSDTDLRMTKESVSGPFDHSALLVLVERGMQSTRMPALTAADGSIDKLLYMKRLSRTIADKPIRVKVYVDSIKNLWD